MLLRGENVSGEDFGSLVKKLRTLPSAVILRTSQTTNIRYADAKALAENTEGVRWLLQATEKHDKSSYKKAHRHFTNAAHKSRGIGDAVAEAFNLRKAAEAALPINQNLDAIKCLMRACRLFKRQKSNDMLYEALGLLYKAVRAFKIQHPASEEKMSRRLAKIRERSQEAFKSRNCETVRPEAFYVGQGQVGFSSLLPIGTENVCECVCVILRDPKTKRTALSHVDSATSMWSLQKIFEHMPPGRRLEAKIIGARYGTDSTDYASINGKKNLNAVISMLKAEQVNVLSCDIDNREQPYAVTVDPLTFDVREERCGLHHPNAALADYLPGFLSKRELTVAFDLDRGEGCRPVYVPVNARDSIRRIAAQSLDEMYLDLSTWVSAPQIPSFIESRTAFVAAFMKNQEQVFSAAQDAIRQYKQKGLAFSVGNEIEIYKHLNTTPLYIGFGAETCNAALIDFVRNDFLQHNRDGALTLNIEGLKRVAEAMHPDHVFAAHKNNPAPTIAARPPGP